MTLLACPKPEGALMTETDVNRDASGEAPEFRNSWLEGPFAPVDQEVTVYDLKVTGTIPADLDGRLLRCGPNPVDPENPVTYNWFTGNGMVHGVRIRDGKAEWYRNRFVRDDQVAASRGLPPLPGPKQLGGGARYVDTNVVNTHISRTPERPGRSPRQGCCRSNFPTNWNPSPSATSAAG